MNAWANVVSVFTRRHPREHSRSVYITKHNCWKVGFESQKQDWINIHVIKAMICLENYRVPDSQRSLLLPVLWGRICVNIWTKTEEGCDLLARFTLVVKVSEEIQDLPLTLTRKNSWKEKNSGIFQPSTCKPAINISNSCLWDKCKWPGICGLFLSAIIVMSE